MKTAACLLACSALTYWLVLRERQARRQADAYANYRRAVEERDMMWVG